MIADEEMIFNNLNQILLHLNEGKMDVATQLLNTIEPSINNTPAGKAFTENLRNYIHENSMSAVFIRALANGNLDSSPPDDPLHKNFVIAQYKQIHSNLLHLTWQTQQIAKGDLRQKVSFMGEFSIGFNKMIEALREKETMEIKIKRQNEELQKLNAEKDKFFSIIAHDLRSPFNGFLGLTKIMTEDLPSLSMENIQLIAESMQKSATNLFRLLENLLEWSKMEQGLIPFSPQMVKLLPVILETTAMVAETAQVKEIVTSVEIPEDLEVFVDKNLIQTVIRNLASNAVKFTPRGGKIGISAKITDDKNVEISIRDSGIGMSPEMVGNLFRLDVQTGREGTEGESSTGLGLILCKEFVEKHGGKIRVESQEGIGSAFHVTFPSPSAL